MKISAFESIDDSSDDSLLMVSYSDDGGQTFKTRSIRMADFIDDFDVGDLANVDEQVPPIDAQGLLWDDSTGQWRPQSIGGTGLGLQGLEYTFTQNIGAVPGDGKFAINTLNLTGPNLIYFDYQSHPGYNVGSFLSNFVQVGQQIYIHENGNPDNYVVYNVTSATFPNSESIAIAISHVDSTTISNGALCRISFIPRQSSGGGGGGLQPGDNVSELVNDVPYLTEESLEGVVDTVDAAILNLKQQILAAAGQPAKTILVVTTTTTGKTQGVSLGDGNVVEVYANGDDYASGTVLYREFMSLGEVICFTNLGGGVIITSTQGFYGCSEQRQGGQQSPMPLSSLGLAFTDTFVYCFRNSQNAPGTGPDTGQIIITCGPLPSKVTITRNDAVVLNQEDIELKPFEQKYFYTNANGEYRITATNPVMGAVQASMGRNPASVPGAPADAGQRFYDTRLIMPLTNDGITWPRSGAVSAPYDNTSVDYYVRDGATGNFVVSPGAPIDYDGTTGAIDADYEPNGATRARAKGLISAYSGADTAGLEASPMLPVSAMSQVVAQPLYIFDQGDGGESSVAIASPYEGTAKYYEWDATNQTTVLKYTIPLTRGNNGTGITLSSPEDQFFPCSGLIANENALAADPSVIQLAGALGAGYVTADVPIVVVSQNSNANFTPNVRSQNGTTTTSIVNEKDETLQLGWTPPLIKAELTTDSSGFVRKREVDGTGAITFPAA
jgi:hypothetical protein